MTIKEQKARAVLTHAWSMTRIEWVWEMQRGPAWLLAQPWGRQIQPLPISLLEGKN